MRLLSRSLLFVLMLAVLLGGGYLSLNLRSSITLREQPLLTLNTRQSAQLAAIEAPIEIYAYIDRNPRLIRAIEDSLIPLRQHLPQLQLRIIDPNTDPVAVKNHDISRIGQIYVQVGDKGERLEFASPEGIARSILTLQGAEARQIVHLQGNGERAPFADIGGSWRDLYAVLQSPQLNIVSIDLKRHINLPENVDLAFIADPDAHNSAHLNAAIDTYLRQGGNLVFSTDTQQHFLPSVLQAISGLRVLPGVVVDTAGQEIGLADPRVIPAATNNQHPITAELTQLPLLAGSVAFADKASSAEGWQRHLLLQSSPRSWNETAPITGHIEHNADADEQAGPLGLAYLLSRDINGKTQTLLILGDSDLFTAAALHRGGNLALAQAIVSHIADTGGSETITRPLLGDQFINLKRSEEFLWAGLLLGFPCLVLLLDLYLRSRFIRRYRLS